MKWNSTVIVLAPYDDLDLILTLERAAEDLLAQGVLDQVFDRPAQRPSTVVGVVALDDQEFLRLVGQDQLETAVGQPAADLRQLDVDDLLEVSLLREWKTITSSSRLRNSGRKYCSIETFSRSFICS